MDSAVSTGELLIWIGLGVFFLLVIIASFIFSVNEWSEKVMSWFRKKK
ncbi:MAG: hypothetical protein JNM27_14885 [Leptospirales bacterium]|nr:hypothetical protein [Leptospirales bacterium]